MHLKKHCQILSDQAKTRFQCKLFPRINYDNALFCSTLSVLPLTLHIFRLFLLGNKNTLSKFLFLLKQAERADST